eukprot:TRINITY_DN12434_c0_g1_i1.p1 TRINITY_DN12434_c0_g1~~TRINITY_DN12434_c0_g1_i1.p1  ORF type:complete len:251 (+),score=36.68 TRINITY_DN12434_c0_g1_i1:112-753(+)
MSIRRALLVFSTHFATAATRPVFHAAPRGFQVGDRVRARKQDEDPWAYGTVAEIAGGKPKVLLYGERRSDSFLFVEPDPVWECESLFPADAPVSGSGFAVGDEVHVRIPADPWIRGTVVQIDMSDTLMVMLHGVPEAAGPCSRGAIAEEHTRAGNKDAQTQGTELRHRSAQQKPCGNLCTGDFISIVGALSILVSRFRRWHQERWCCRRHGRQ